jgi:hypothetical protein
MINSPSHHFPGGDREKKKKRKLTVAGLLPETKNVGLRKEEQPLASNIGA